MQRSAHSCDHHNVSFAVAKVQVDELKVTSVQPAARAQPSSARPASGFGPVVSGDFRVYFPPPFEAVAGGRPPKPSVVTVAYGHNPALTDQQRHRCHRTNGITQMLKHLVSVDDVEGLLFKPEVSKVACSERDVRRPRLSRVSSRLPGDRLGGVDGEDFPRRDRPPRGPQ